MKLGSGDRVLVTGASGVIGSALTRNLLVRELEVVALVEPGADVGNLEGLEVKQVIGDVREPSSVQSAVTGCRAAFHVAALYRFWARDPADFYAVNVGGTRHVLESAAARRIPAVHVSSVVALGPTGDQPVGESHWAGGEPRSAWAASAAWRATGRETSSSRSRRRTRGR